MFPKWLKFTLRYYCLWGFHCSTRNGFIEKLISIFIFLSHIGLCTWCSINLLRAFAEKLALMEYLDALNFHLYYIANVSTYWLILYDSYNNHNDQYVFWQIFRKIDIQLYSQSKIKKWTYLITLASIFTANISVVVFALVREVKSSYDLRLMHFIYLCMMDHRIFFYLLHLKIVAFQLKIIKMEIYKMQQQFEGIASCMVNQ